MLCRLDPPRRLDPPPPPPPPPSQMQQRRGRVSPLEAACGITPEHGCGEFTDLRENRTAERLSACSSSCESVPDSRGKEIGFPVLNAESFTRCLCPDWSPKRPPSCPPAPAPPHKGRGAGSAAAPPCLISCCTTVGQWFKKFHFLMSQAAAPPRCERHLELRPGYFKPFVHCPPAPNLPRPWRHESRVLCPPNLSSTLSPPQKRSQGETVLSHLGELIFIPSWTPPPPRGHRPLQRQQRLNVPSFPGGSDGSNAATRYR